MGSASYVQRFSALSIISSDSSNKFRGSGDRVSVLCSLGIQLDRRAVEANLNPEQVRKGGLRMMSRFLSHAQTGHIQNRQLDIVPFRVGLWIKAS